MLDMLTPVPRGITGVITGTQKPMGVSGAVIASLINTNMVLAEITKVTMTEYVLAIPVHVKTGPQNHGWTTRIFALGIITMNVNPVMRATTLSMVSVC